jgi:hypothetical protein
VARRIYTGGLVAGISLLYLLLLPELGTSSGVKRLLSAPFAATVQVVQRFRISDFLLWNFIIVSGGA